MLAALCDVLNRIWAQRDSITPASSRRRQPGLLDVWKLLPHSDCKQCGLPTCMAYAAALLRSDATMDNCPKLLASQAAGQQAALVALLNLQPGKST